VKLQMYCFGLTTHFVISETFCVQSFVTMYVCVAMLFV